MHGVFSALSRLGPPAAWEAPRRMSHFLGISIQRSDYLLLDQPMAKSVLGLRPHRLFGAWVQNRRSGSGKSEGCTMPAAVHAC
jgi:hypothetical protein